MEKRGPWKYEEIQDIDIGFRILDLVICVLTKCFLNKHSLSVLFNLKPMMKTMTILMADSSVL